MRQCLGCQDVLPLAAFYSSAKVIRGRSYTCVSSRCKTCSNEKNKANVRKNPASKRRAGVKFKYGLTWPQFTKLYEDQHGVCAICTTPLRIEFGLARGQSKLCVDHCHDTGKVRGLLCKRCNTGLGQLGETKDKLLKAIAYLENPPFKGAE